tara:strand:+ start:62 stop:277 length:216 start_codon:yes stop_codon:yes gene_type:complete
MKTIILVNLLVITSIYPIVIAHENHDHNFYYWSNSKNKTIKSDRNLNLENIEDKKIKKYIIKNSWKKIFRR